jgi:pimeloyl-ACP methyl ester carboxylesterase
MSDFFVTIDGFTLAYHELSGGQHGPPIVLLHRFTSTTRNDWVDFGIAERLSVLERRIIGLDALGHGASERPRDRRHYGEARMALDVSALVSHLSLETFDLVGYSLGAVTALLCAVWDRRLRRLVVGGVGESVVSLGGVDTRVLDNHALSAVLLAEEPSNFPGYLRRIRKQAEQRGNDPLALGALAAVVHARPIALHRITAPTLVIAGDTDALSAHPETLAAQIAQARLASRRSW